MMMRPESVTSVRRISGLTAVEYHAMRALSASGAWLLAEECAAKFLWRSPWNPLYVAEAKSEFDIGVAAHLAVNLCARPTTRAGSANRRSAAADVGVVKRGGAQAD